MPFAAYRRLSWQDGGIARGPLKDSIEDALRSDEADDPNFVGVAEGENELELPEILLPKEVDYLSMVRLAVQPMVGETKR